MTDIHRTSIVSHMRLGTDLATLARTNICMNFLRIFEVILNCIRGLTGSVGFKQFGFGPKLVLQELLGADWP